MAGSVSGRPAIWVQGVRTQLSTQNGHAFKISSAGDIALVKFNTGEYKVWTSSSGLLSISQYLAQQGLGADIVGWTFHSVADISPDGTYLVGTGQEPGSPAMTAWIADTGPDSDGDGARDEWELDGIPVSGGGVALLPNADPLKPNIWLEIDTATAPGISAFSADAISKIETVFRKHGYILSINASGACPAPYELGIPAGQGSNRALIEILDPFRAEFLGDGGAESRALSRVYRYAVVTGALRVNGSVGGQAELPGALLAFGVQRIGELLHPELQPKFTMADIEAALVMHELGHALGLRHGGNDDGNSKVNYPSIMNYSFTMPRPHTAFFWRLDYSPTEMFTELCESALDESAGVRSLQSPWSFRGMWAPYATGNSLTPTGIASLEGLPVDWNGDLEPTIGAVSVDLNFWPSRPLTQNNLPSPGELQRGFSDWAALAIAIPRVPAGCYLLPSRFMPTCSFYANVDLDEILWLDSNVPIPSTPQVAVGDAAPLNTNAASDSGDDLGQVMALGSDAVVVTIWRSVDSLGGTVGTDSDILFARSVDSGRTWSAPAALHDNAFNDSGFDSNARVAAAGSVFVCVWQSTENLGGTAGNDDDVFVSRSADGGATWSTPTTLSNLMIGDSVFDGIPDIATDGNGNWIACWERQDPSGGANDNDIFAVMSVDDGVSWGAPFTINSRAAVDVGRDTNSRVLWTSGVWLALWRTNELVPGVAGDFDFVLSRSVDGGVIWSQEITVEANAAADSTSDVRAPKIVSDQAGNLVAVWAAQPTPEWFLGRDLEVMVARSTDLGLTWSDPVPLNHWASEDGDSVDDVVWLANDGNGQWLALWESTFRPDSLPDADRDIWMCVSNDAGLTWSRSMELDPNYGANIADDRFPQALAVGPQQWLITWRTNGRADGTIGSDFDIWFRVPPEEELCPGDANGDNTVNFDDINTVIANWLAIYTPGTGSGDANGDGIVNFDDINSVIANWLSVCP